MSSQLNVDTIVDKAGSGGTNVKIANTSVTVAEGGSGTTNTVQGLCKAWCVFDQVNSNTVDDSFNIGSVTDRGTGSMYGVYTNNMSSINYTVMGAASNNASGSMTTSNNNRSIISSADTTARYSMNVFKTNDIALINGENQQTNVHGDLA